MILLSKPTTSSAKKPKRTPLKPPKVKERWLDPRSGAESRHSCLRKKAIINRLNMKDMSINDPDGCYCNNNFMFLRS